MKENPCKGCENAYICAGRSKPGRRNECYRCQKRKEHEKWLKSRRKFVEGEDITSLDELMAEEYVMCNGKPLHNGWFGSWQLDMALQYIQAGGLKKAVRMEDHMNTVKNEKLRRTEFNEFVREALREMWLPDEPENGSFEVEIYADYRDEISEKEVTSICESEDPEMAFCDYLEEAYRTAVDEAEDDVELHVRTWLTWLESAYQDGLSDEQEEWLTEFLQENVSYKLPYDHFLDQTVKVDIFVDTGDANFDFVLNCVCPAWDGYDGEIDPKASIRWLAETQGYSEPQLRAALAEGDMADPKTFLESLRVELTNTPSHIMALCFLAEMTVRDVLALNMRMKKQAVDGKRPFDALERLDCGTIHISKDAETGLYDMWNGGGGPFEIILEKDVDLPLRFIYSALPDGGEGRWSISDTYGMCGSAWRDVVSNIREREEDTK